VIGERGRVPQLRGSFAPILSIEFVIHGRVPKHLRSSYIPQVGSAESPFQSRTASSRVSMTSKFLMTK
jgi:hypothetical protein